MAAPHVSGVAALLASTHPNATPKQLTKLLDDEADPIPCPADYDLNGTGTQDAYCTGDTTFNSFYGHGMVDALAAVSGSQDNTAAPSGQASVPAQTSPPPAIATTNQPKRQPATSPQPARTPTTPAAPATHAAPATAPPTPTLTPAGGPIGGFALLGMW
jgi:subtilisin family serine protease